MIFFLFPLLIFSTSSIAYSENVKTVHLCEKNVAEVLVSPRGTVIEFPIEPEKVILGSKNSFSIEYVRSDLAISPATSGSHSNLFVYLQGRRFVLDLMTSPSNGYTIYFVKDCLEDRIKPKPNGK